MTTTLDSVAQEAMVLPPDQRVALAYQLLVSVDPVSESGADVAWESEISTRINRFDAGESTPMPASEFFSRLREVAPAR